MREAIILVHYPRGDLPIKGYRCSAGHERIPLDEAKRAELTANRLGLFGRQNERRRKLVTVGTSKAVTLPPEDIREVLHSSTSVIVARVGDHIEIHASGERDNAPEKRPSGKKRARRSASSKARKKPAS